MPRQSRLFVDYQNDPASLKQFYPNAVETIRELAAQVPDVLSAYVTDRDALCDALAEINTSFGAGEKTHANIDRLRRTDAVTVVTGQQAGLFSGPLYTIYKAISAIKTADFLMADRINAVPVFWIATEDHDFDEVSKAYAFRLDGEIAEATVENGNNRVGIPVGNVKLGSGIREIIERFVAELPATEFTSELEILLADLWVEGSTFGAAFGKTLARIFAGYGLIFLDPMNTELKHLASPIYVRAIEKADEIVSALVDRGRKLEYAGYHTQVLVADDYFPLFWHTDLGVRSSLRKIGDGRYRSKEDKREFDVAHLAGIAAKEPARFSPGVMLRAAVQDYLLPSICYFGGGAEIAYFAQNSEVYRVLERPVTPIFHRQSYSIVESKHARTLAEFGLDFTDLFEGIDALVPRIIERYISPETARIFADVEGKINTELNRLDRMLSGLDATLAESLARRRKKVLYHIAALRKKAYRSEMQRNEVVNRRVESAVNSLLPDGQLQERIINVASFLNKYGPYFIDWVYDLTEIDERGHKLIYL